MSWLFPGAQATDFARGERLLTEHTDALLGPATNGRLVRIMVTMPSEAADDYLLVHRLMQQGMDCMRINCAHDDAAAWTRMIEHVKQAERALGRSCRVFMDLAGPKLRTGPLEPGPAVLRLHSCRDVCGRVTAPSQVRVRITQDYLRAVNLRADKGINLPDSELRIAAMTDKDIEDLPDMLLIAMRAPQCGVMIARGDLAVECGFERLAHTLPIESDSPV